MIPPQTILAAVDFSEPSRSALAFAARLARHSRATLHVLHVLDPVLAAAAGRGGIDLARDTRTELEAFIHSSAEAHTVAAHVLTGTPVDTIGAVAQRQRADVIVVAAHGMSGAERAVFGSTTEGVLRHVERSVLVVPSGWTPPRSDVADLTGIGPIVAAMDLSTRAFAAARGACRLAALVGTSVDVVHVVPDLPVLQRWSAHARDAVRQRTEAAEAELRSTLHHLQCDVPVSHHVEVGRVEERLAAHASAHGTHPILVLGRSSGDERGGAPGRTAYRVLMQVSVPVLMYVPEQ